MRFKTPRTCLPRSGFVQRLIMCRCKRGDGAWASEASPLIVTRDVASSNPGPCPGAPLV